MSFDHSGRVAFLTGAGSGIGRATAMRLGSEGAGVAVVDVNAEGADETVSSIEDAGGMAISLHADVRDRGQIEAARDEAIGRLGPIRYLVNNAGVLGCRRSTSCPRTNGTWSSTPT